MYYFRSDIFSYLDAHVFLHCKLNMHKDKFKIIYFYLFLGKNMVRLFPEID